MSLLRQLLEAAHPYTPPQRKLKQLSALLTPEVIKANHEMLISLIATKMSSDDIKQLEKVLRGDELLSGGEAEEVMALMAKAITQAGGKVVQQAHELLANDPMGPLFHVAYKKGRWMIAHQIYEGDQTDKLDSDEGALEHVQKLMRDCKAKVAFFDALAKQLPKSFATHHQGGWMYARLGGAATFRIAYRHNGTCRVYNSNKHGNSGTIVQADKVLDFIRDNA